MSYSEENNELLKEYEAILKSTVIRGNATQEETSSLLEPILRLANRLRPQVLYRYRECTEYNFDALLNDRVYFNSPLHFNDPYDCLSYIDLEKVKSVLHEIQPEKTITEMHAMRNSTHLIKECFSPNILPATQALYDWVKGMSDAEFILATERIQQGFANDEHNIPRKRMEEFIALNHSMNHKIAREE